MSKWQNTESEVFAFTLQNIVLILKFKRCRKTFISMAIFMPKYLNIIVVMKSIFRVAILYK